LELFGSRSLFYWKSHRSIREAVNIIESAEGARDRMLANIKRKVAEQAAGEDTYSTPALKKNIPFKRFVKQL
jgi:hypothetical protein